MESNQRPPACNSTALAPRAIYDTEGGRRVNNTTLFSSVVLLRPYTPGSGLCRSVFSRPVCPYAIMTFDPVTRDVTILPGAVPAGAARPAHSLGGGGRPRWGGAAPDTPDGWLHVFRVSLQRMDRMGRTDQLVRYSDGRYLTFDPTEVAGCSAALDSVTDTRQSAELHSLRASHLSPPTPPHYARACVLRWDVWIVRSSQTNTHCACAGGRGTEAVLRHVSVSERPTTDIRETCTYRSPLPLPVSPHPPRPVPAGPDRLHQMT